MNQNPYSTPPSTVIPSGSALPGTISSAVIEQLRRTKGWVRFLSVLIFIGAGFMILFGIFMILAGTVLGGGIMSSSFSNAANDVGGSVVMIVIAVCYIIFAIFYLIPGTKLWKYASAIERLMTTTSETDLIAALDQQRAFWKFIGVLTICIIALYPLAAIIMGVFMGISAATSGNIR